MTQTDNQRTMSQAKRLIRYIALLNIGAAQVATGQSVQWTDAEGKFVEKCQKDSLGLLRPGLESALGTIAGHVPTKAVGYTAIDNRLTYDKTPDPVSPTKLAKPGTPERREQNEGQRARDVLALLGNVVMAQATVRSIAATILSQKEAKALNKPLGAKDRKVLDKIASNIGDPRYMAELERLIAEAHVAKAKATEIPDAVRLEAPATV